MVTPERRRGSNREANGSLDRLALNLRERERRPSIAAGRGWTPGTVSRQRRLLHRHRLPAAVPPEKDARVPDLSGERDAAKRAGVVGDAG